MLIHKKNKMWTNHKLKAVSRKDPRKCVGNGKGKCSCIANEVEIRALEWKRSIFRRHFESSISFNPMLRRRRKPCVFSARKASKLDEIEWPTGRRISSHAMPSVFIQYIRCGFSNVLSFWKVITLTQENFNRPSVHFSNCRSILWFSQNYIYTIHWETLHIWLVKVREKLFVMGDTYDVFNGIKTRYFEAYGCIIIQLFTQMRRKKRES